MGHRGPCRKETAAGRQRIGFRYRRQKPCAGSLTRGRGQQRHPDSSEAAMEPYNHLCRPRGDTECGQTKWKEVTHRRLESWRAAG